MRSLVSNDAERDSSRARLAVDFRKMGRHATKKAARNVAEMGLDELLGADVLDSDPTSEGRDPVLMGKGKGNRGDEGESSSDDPVSSDDGSSDVEFDQEDIERLKEQDPDFYKYLKDTDEGLLDFRDEEDDDEGGEDDDEEDDEEDDDGRAADSDDDAAKKASGVITSESLKSWCQAAQKNASVGAVRQVTRLYRIACHYGDEEDHDESLKLASSAVYNNILLFMLGKADGIFRKALGMSAADDDPTKRARYTKYAPFVRSYLGNTLHLLDKMTDPSMQGYILKRLRHSVAFLGDFDKIRRKFIALSLKIFSSAEDEPRVQAILFVRACAITLPTLCLDPCLKGVYKSFVGASKFFSPASAPGIRFMATCSVEMYGVDLTATYQHAFVAIKGLAGQMRQALTSKSKESYKEVYCWQTINALELWATVLVAHPVDLEPLFYPLTQLLLGACTLVGSPSFIPLRLKCVRMLNELARARDMYVPVSPVLVEVLQWKDLSKKAKPVPANSIPDINLRLRVGSSILRASAFQEDVVDTTYELLSDHLAQWGSHPGFLEIAYIPLLRLRAFVKSSNKDRFKRGARQLCQAILDTQERIGKARNRAQFSPKDGSSIQQFRADLDSEGPSPIAGLAKSLGEQAVQRMKMRSMEDVMLEDDDDDDDERDEAEGHRGGHVYGGNDEDDDRDEDDQDAHQAVKRRKVSDMSSESDLEDYEDRVEQYQFSDDDDDDDDDGDDGDDDD